MMKRQRNLGAELSAQEISPRTPQLEFAGNAYIPVHSSLRRQLSLLLFVSADANLSTIFRISSNFMRRRC